MVQLLEAVFLILLCYQPPELSCVDHVGLRGPRAVSLYSSLTLTCSLTTQAGELSQLDIKWYKDQDQTPFLQWIPSLSRKPQILEQSRSVAGNVKVQFRRYNVSKKSTSGRQRIEQMVVFENITTEMSGDFHCRVATFSQELIRSLKISVFGLYSPYRIFWTGGHSVFSLFRPRDWAPAPPLPAGR